MTSRPAVSVDEMIVAETGQSIPEIFSTRGEPAFRQLELAALQSLEPDRPLVVDSGGGIVNTPAAVELLRRRGVVIWLDEPWGTIRSRLRGTGGDDRPLVRSLGWDGLEDLFRGRRSLYAAAADFRLSSLGGDLEGLTRRAMLRSLIWERRQEGNRT